MKKRLSCLGSVADLFRNATSEKDMSPKVVQAMKKIAMFPELRGPLDQAAGRVDKVLCRGVWGNVTTITGVNEGLIIPNDCHTCHIILVQGNSGPTETVNMEIGQQFRHPVDIGMAWRSTRCYECQSGAHP